MIELSYGYQRLGRVVGKLQKQYDKKPTDDLKMKLDKFRALRNERDAKGVNRALASMGIAVSGRERLYKFEAIGELIEFGLVKKIGSVVKLPFRASKYGPMKGVGRRRKLLRSSKVGKMDEVDTPTSLKPDNLEEVMNEPIEFARLQRLKRYVKRHKSDGFRLGGKPWPGQAQKKLKRAEHSGKLRAFRKTKGEQTPEQLKHTGGSPRRKTKGRQDEVLSTTMRPVREGQPAMASGNTVAGVKGKVKWSEEPVIGVKRSRGKGTVYQGRDEDGHLVKQYVTRRGVKRVVR